MLASQAANVQIEGVSTEDAGAKAEIAIMTKKDELGDLRKKTPNLTIDENGVIRFRSKRYADKKPAELGEGYYEEFTESDAKLLAKLKKAAFDNDSD